VTDTDLITADGSNGDVELPSAVNPQTFEAVSAAPAQEPAPAPAAVAAPAERRASLTAMVLPDLRALASQLGIKGSSGMRKSELIAAIREHRGETNGAAAAAVTPPATTEGEPAQAVNGTADGAAEVAPQRAPRRERRGASRGAGAPVDAPASDEKAAQDTTDEKVGQEKPQAEAAAKADDKADAKAEVKVDAKAEDKVDAKADDKTAAKADDKVDVKADDKADVKAEVKSDAKADDKSEAKSDEKNDRRRDSAQSDGSRNDRQNKGNESNNARGNSGNNANTNANDNDDDGDGDGRQGRRGRRFRDRRRRGERGGEAGGTTDRDAELREDDVVQPVAGILDVLDNYAFVRTSGYLAGTNDVYVSMNMVRKNGLRRGDAITGAVRISREGEGQGSSGQNPRQKFNPLVRLDTVNGGPVDDAKNRPEFGKLTPLYPNQRLRLETTPDRLTTRVIDLIMPIGKGQRALIVSPPKAGKTMILQSIANAITTNNPECHLMVVLVDERPEEVTDMQRSVKGEVIASTFDRPPSDHTAVAELAIERAKRLVEQGRDVVVLLDSITRLGRAYNNASPASGRILSGGVDSTALYPPKRFLGAARNIEHGGSLTIIATAMVETGSTGDTVIFEEFKGTGNAELKLDRKIAERRVFPAVDVNPSGTRKDELLLSPDEFSVVHKLRRVLSGLDSHQAIDLLMSQLRKTKTNYEFLVQVSKTTPGNMDSD
jgi:transcription termination factor Rho